MTSCIMPVVKHGNQRREEDDHRQHAQGKDEAAAAKHLEHFIGDQPAEDETNPFIAVGITLATPFDIANSAARPAGTYNINAPIPTGLSSAEHGAQVNGFSVIGEQHSNGQ